MPCVLGVDYGSSRLGLALSDPEAMVAMPLRVVEVASDRDRIDAVTGACREEHAGRVVVGLPLNMDGSSGPMAQRVVEFTGKLQAVLSVPIETWDERLSSREAERALLEGNLSRRKRRRLRDKMAAQIILQAYLDARPTAGP